MCPPKSYRSCRPTGQVRVVINLFKFQFRSTIVHHASSRPIPMVSTVGCVRSSQILPTANTSFVSLADPPLSHFVSLCLSLSRSTSLSTRGISLDVQQQTASLRCRLITFRSVCISITLDRRRCNGSNIVINVPNNQRCSSFLSLSLLSPPETPDPNGSIDVGRQIG